MGYNQRPGNPKGTLALILGILSVTICGCLTGIPAIYLGMSAEEEAVTPQDAQFGKVGKILGIISLAILCLVGGLQVLGASATRPAAPRSRFYDSDGKEITDPSMRAVLEAGTGETKR